jgi:NADH dehydrogenase [ubiquinone] 1 alpha subcomplex assembly factor 7
VSDTPLAEKLKRLIEANGPMSIADYMAHCLSDPEHGYYTTRDPFGAHGDFITAPEVSQMFGEIVGAWLIEAWRLCGSPSPVQLVELGPGRGTLMADILRVAAKVPEFAEAIRVHLIEISPALRTRQAETLAAFKRDVEWHTSFSDVPKGPLLLIANEFFDALPIRQYVRSKSAWRERVVGLDAGGKLTFGIGAGTASVDDAVAQRATEGSVMEACSAANALMTEIVSRIVEYGGAALIIDYGYDAPSLADTLQAVRGHNYADPLDAPGEADLTAHVDFGTLARTARTVGASVHGPMNQGDFLISLGLLERAGRLGRNADETARETLRLAVERLAGPDQMGTLFKTMAITQTSVAPPFIG